MGPQVRHSGRFQVGDGIYPRRALLSSEDSLLIQPPSPQATPPLYEQRPRPGMGECMFVSLGTSVTSSIGGLLKVCTSIEPQEDPDKGASRRAGSGG